MLYAQQLCDNTVTAKPIQTWYANRRFRSRLEARWAVALDRLSIQWMYEHQGYETKAGAYLPDFWLPELNTFLEIKAGWPTEEERVKLISLIENEATYGAFGMSFDGKCTNTHLFPGDDFDFQNPWPKNLPRPKEARIIDIALLESDEDNRLVCPFCGHTNVHCGEPKYLTDDYTHDYVRQRGPITVIPMFGEFCDHKWELIIAFHKGDTFVSACLPDYGNKTPLEIILSGPDGRAAMNYAASARFEHGETP
jgi:hypothetical protein